MYNELIEYCKLNRLSIDKVSGNKLRVSKKSWNIVKDIFEVIDKDKDVEIRFFDGRIENQSKECFIDYLKGQIKQYKMLRNLVSSSRPLKKMQYVHNGITEMGIKYCKDKSGIYSKISNKL